MDILRISVLGVGGVLIGLLLKERAPEYVKSHHNGDRACDPGTCCGKRSAIFLNPWSG